MYFQALDAIINAINDRFEQPALKIFMNVEQLLLKSIVKDDISMELKDLEVHFGGDFNAIQLESDHQTSTNHIWPFFTDRFP